MPSNRPDSRRGTSSRWREKGSRLHRTIDNRLDGAVLSFVDVDVLKRALHGAESARDYSRGIVETVPISLVVLDARTCPGVPGTSLYA